MYALVVWSNNCFVLILHHVPPHTCSKLVATYVHEFFVNFLLFRLPMEHVHEVFWTCQEHVSGTWCISQDVLFCHIMIAKKHHFFHGRVDIDIKVSFHSPTSEQQRYHQHVIEYYFTEVVQCLPWIWSWHHWSILFLVSLYNKNVIKAMFSWKHPLVLRIMLN